MKSSPTGSVSLGSTASTEPSSPHLVLQQLVAENRVEPDDAMLWMIHAYRYAQLAHAMADLGIADELATGSLTTDELAKKVHVPAEALVRLLRGLAWCGAVVPSEAIEHNAGSEYNKGSERAEDDERWSLTPLGRTLDSNAEGSLANDAVQAGSLLYPAWGKLASGLRTSRVPFEVAHGQSFFDELSNNPTMSERFDRVMNRITVQTAEAVAATLDFTGARCVVDVGGGNGETLARLLAHAPDSSGIVFDLARSQAAALANLTRHGCAERCEFVAGSFFEAKIPSGDVYILQRILHDWDDPHCVRILAGIAQAVLPDARVLVLEELLGVEKPGPSDHAVAIDLAMMAVTGGRERSLAQYEALALQAGLRLVDTYATPPGIWIIELAA